MRYCSHTIQKLLLPPPNAVYDQLLSALGLLFSHAHQSDAIGKWHWDGPREELPSMDNKGQLILLRQHSGISLQDLTVEMH